MKKIVGLILVTYLLNSCNLFRSSDKIELIPFLQKDKYGYFDLEGKIIINPQFENATAFREGLALVSISAENNTKWGFINKDGKFVINAIYKSATVFQEGLAWVVTDNSAPSVIDKKGEIKFTLKDANEVKLYSDGLAAYSVVDTINNSRWGFVDKSGNTTITPQFEDVDYFSDDKCAVKNKEGKWGYIDDSGKIIINYQFNKAFKFKNGKAIVSLDNKYGVIDTDGKYIINPQYTDAVDDGDMLLVSQENKVGWCDNEGKFIINPQFDQASPFGDSDIASVESGGKYGFIDKTGKIMINPQFDFASAFSGDIAIVRLGDKFGLIDEEGKYKVNPQFDHIEEDLFSLLYDKGSTRESIYTDYLDVSSIVNSINFDNPENININDNFQTIFGKLHKSIDNITPYSSQQIIFESKKINKDARYSFYINGGVAKEMSSDTYEFYITKESPNAFIYVINLTGRAYGKSNSIQKAFEEKLNGLKLIKKGVYRGRFAGVYSSKNEAQIVLINDNDSQIIVQIIKKSYDISEFLNSIIEGNSSEFTESENNNEYQYQEDQIIVDSAAVAAPAAAPAAEYYEYDSALPVAK